MHLQKASLDTPFMRRRFTSPVDHKWRAEAEHDPYEIR